MITTKNSLKIEINGMIIDLLEDFGFPILDNSIYQGKISKDSIITEKDGVKLIINLSTPSNDKFIE